MKKLNLLVSLLLLTALSSCAFGRKINYQGVSTFTPPLVQGQSAIAVQDRRPYVLSNDKNPDWVGLSRALSGIPYGVHTQSGKPLSDDLGSLVVNTFNKDGIVKAYQIVLTPNDNLDFALSKRNHGEDLLFIISVLEWKTDVYFNAKFNYEVSLNVYSGNQNLVSNVVKGSDGLGSSNPKRLNLAVATADIFDSLINAPTVVEAINKYQGAKSEHDKTQNKATNSSKQIKKDPSQVRTNNESNLDSTKERMDKLKKARDQGVLTEEEYQQKRKAVVDAL